MAETLATLLRAARLAERRSITILKGKMEIIDDLDVYKQFQSHLVETQWQVKLLEACLEFQGADKDEPDLEAFKIASEVGSAGLFAMKRFEIGLYKRIIAAAREANAVDVLQACREILEQERAMAEWIESSFGAESVYLPQESALATYS
jgi:ferritin-like metal-binding protein YciE